MSEQADTTAELRELAANRGLRLVKSGRRNPEAADYGRFGLVDTASGEKLFGFRRTRVSATAEEIQGFLTQSAEESWRRSIPARWPAR